MNTPGVHQRGLMVSALVLAAYLAGVGALLVGKVTGSTAAWWPAAGIGVAAMLLTQRRHWPAVLAGLTVAFTLANLTMGRPWLVSTLLGLSDIAETAIVAVLLARFVGSRLSNVQDVWRLFAIATAGALVAAVGVSLVYQQFLGAHFWTTLLLTFPSHAASVIMLAPIALLSVTPFRPGVPRKVELAAQVFLLVSATLITFAGAQVTLGFAPLPVIVWAAVRFRPGVVVVEQIIYATVVTLLTQYGAGPFSPDTADLDPGLSTLHAQLYLICMVLIGLPLAKAMEQHDTALSKVRDSERTFRRNFTESRVPVTILERRGDELFFTECNDATVDLLGQPATELTDRRVADLLTSPELQEAASSIVRGDSSGWWGRIRVTAAPATRLDGTLSLLEADAHSATFSLTLMDVTEHLELQAHREVERNYTRAVIDTARSMIVLTRLDGTVIAANPATTRITGYSEAELVGHPVWEYLLTGGQRDDATEYFAAQQLPRNGEAKLQTKNGQQLAVMYSSDVHQASTDAPVTVVLSATDVTDARQNAGMVNHLLRSARTIAFVGTDLSGRITLFNTGAEHMLGISAESATGRELVDFIAAEDLTRYAAENECDLEGGATTFDAMVNHSAGDLTPETRDCNWLPEGRPSLRVSMTTNPVTDTFGDLFGYLFVANDIADIYRSQQILVRALHREREVVSRLKELDNVKDDFVTTVSHELRTPMSSIIGSAEMLADGMVGELGPEQQRMVEVISRNGDRLLALADNLLLLATFDHRAEPDHGLDIDLRDVVEESASAVASILANRDLRVSYTLPEDPVLVNGDSSHLERAITNLLTNAVKFTPDGGAVHLVVESRPLAQSAVLSVTDTGLGIPATDLDHVFGRFYRSAVVQEKAIQGSGLGLSIVKTIVESHEGSIKVESEAGKGTTFTMCLPLVMSKIAVGEPVRLG